MAISSPIVPLQTATQCRTPILLATCRSSNSWTVLTVVRQPALVQQVVNALRQSLAVAYVWAPDMQDVAKRGFSAGDGQLPDLRLLDHLSVGRGAMRLHSRTMSRKFSTV